LLCSARSSGFFNKHSYRRCIAQNPDRVQGSYPDIDRLQLSTENRLVTAIPIAASKPALLQYRSSSAAAFTTLPCDFFKRLIAAV
jgi:hypothetical protein